MIGVILAFIGAFILLSTISFFFTGAADQSKVINKSFFELITYKQVISNWTGVAGAFIAQRIVNQWFGIFALIIPMYLILVGLKLMRVLNISAIRTFLLSAFVLIWADDDEEGYIDYLVRKGISDEQLCHEFYIKGWGIKDALKEYRDKDLH